MTDLHILLLRFSEFIENGWKEGCIVLIRFGLLLNISICLTF